MIETNHGNNLCVFAQTSINPPTSLNLLRRLYHLQTSLQAAAGHIASDEEEGTCTAVLPMVAGASIRGWQEVGQTLEGGGEEEGVGVGGGIGT